MFKPRNVGGGGDASVEGGPDGGDNLAKGGMVVVQTAGHGDEGVGQVGGVEENGPEGCLLADVSEQVVQVHALGGVVVGEISNGKQILDDDSVPIVLDHGSISGEILIADGHGCLRMRAS